ncbi:MAG: mono/diheme cytochrome c family protein [Bacteroidia bacterium]|jgi:mono/diheme cytochrome c family protein
MILKQMKRQRNITAVFAILGVSVLFGGCYSSGNDPGIEYAPNMYVSEAYEAYSQTQEMEYNPYGMTMRMPVKGTIARGQMNYLGYPEGYEASASWTSKIASTEKNVTEGQRLYNIYCQHCHGKTGKNDGGVIKSGQYPPPPWAGYSDDIIKNLSDGQMFHTITFGKGNMGSHASVLTPEQRWQVIGYVRKLSLGDDFVYANEAIQALVVSQDTTSLAVPAEMMNDHGHDHDHAGTHNMHK